MKDNGPRSEAPDGYRLLLQIFDSPTADDAKAEIFRMFGPLKCDGMLLKEGSYRCDWDGPGWTKQKTGFMAFIVDKP